LESIPETKNFTT